MKNVINSTEYIMGRLKEDEEYYRLQMDFMNAGIGKAYEAAGKENTSDNVFLNVLFENKRKKAKEAGAHIDINIEADKESLIEVRDIIIIVANLLDNAIEAAVQNHVNNRDIKTVGIIKGGRFFLQVQNPYEREPVMSGGELETTKDSKEGHGLGLKSVRRIVEKYGMEMEIVMEGGMFCVTVEKKK